MSDSSSLSVSFLFFISSHSQEEANAKTTKKICTWLLEPGEGKMLLRRTNEGEGSDDGVDGDEGDGVSTTVDDENGLDPANPRGQAL